MASRRAFLARLGGSALAMRAGAARPQADAARRILVYTSLPVDDMRALVAAFRAAHGIDVDVWRAGSEKVVARVVTEAKAGRHDVDVIETNGSDLETLARQRLLEPLRLPQHADLVDGSVPPGAAWAGTRLGIFVQAYNTARVSREELPKRWSDLADARWKGRLAIEAEDADWFSGIAGVLGENEAVALFRDIVRTNGVSVRKGHSLIAQMVAAGEIDFALTAYNYRAQQLKEKGAPLDWYAIPPAIAKANGIALATRAPRREAAKLFCTFALSREGQAVLLAREHVPTHRDVRTPLRELPMRMLDAGRVLDGANLWRERFASVFLQGSR
jgi:iron(III) transport system substrate-binding protein